MGIECKIGISYLGQEKVRRNDRQVLGMILSQEGTGKVLGCSSLASVSFLSFSLSFPLPSSFLSTII